MSTTVSATAASASTAAAWSGGHYVADTTVINNTTIVNNTTINRVSYNGGAGGVAATPSPAEQRYAQEQHVPLSAMQQQHEQAAARDTTMRASYNHGSPSVAATPKAGIFYGKGVVAARVASAGGVPHAPMKEQAPRAAMNEQAGRVGGAAHAGQSHGAPPSAPHAPPPVHHPRVARRMAPLALRLTAHTRPHRPGTVVRRTASRRMASRTLSPTAITASRPAEVQALLVEEVPGTGPHSQAGS